MLLVSMLLLILMMMHNDLAGVDFVADCEDGFVVFGVDLSIGGIAADCSTDG